MKNKLIKLGTALMSLYIVFVGVISVSATPPASYSKSSNSGTRHEVCTTLDGTSASGYYTGDYTYEKLAGLSGSALKSSLNTLMTSTHKTKSSYADCKEKARFTDCENNNTSLFSTIYTSYSASYSQFNSGNGWNREHIWPKSLGGFDNTGAGADLHHIRPSENRTNSVRGNLKYGNVSSGSQATGNLSGLNGGNSGSYYEPLDNVKGDVARIILYVHVRYYTTYPKCQNVTNVFESVDVLLEWCELDPVDTWEMGRNEVVHSIQGNRNVFIDYPELAWVLFDEEIPCDMVTPSMSAKNGDSGEDVSETATDVHTETDTESGSETITVMESESQVDNGNQTESETIIDTEIDVEITTESDSKATTAISSDDEKQPEEQSSDQTFEGTKPVETDADSNIESEMSTQVEKGDVGCVSSLSGGATIISVVFIAAYTVLRKKKEF